MKFKYIIVLLVFFSGCKKVFFDEDPVNTPENNFEIFWNDFDRYYVYFQYNNINWDSVYKVYRPQISSNTTDRVLFTVFSDMVNILKDGHVNVHSPYGIASYEKTGLSSYPSRSLLNFSKYISQVQGYGDIIEYSDVKDHNIGFIKLKSFAGNGSIDDRYGVIDEILELYKAKDGIIIDVRRNGGGSDYNALTIASRFVDTKRIFSWSRTKNGPGKDDYSEWSDISIEPKGIFQFTKPLVVLTSRVSFSSTESFVMAMKVLPQVILVGDTTGGGQGSPIYRELPNGWFYRLSTTMTVDADFINYEGKGIPPDVPVQNSVEDSINGIDRILEKGIEIIENTK